MPTRPAIANVAALNLERVSVPDWARCTVQSGTAMRVSTGFVIDGELVLLGSLKVVTDGDD